MGTEQPHWRTLQLGYRFHFLKETQTPIARIRIDETISELVRLPDPKEHPLLLSCDKTNTKCVVSIPDTNLVIAITIHDDNDPHQDWRHCIELVHIINLDIIGNE